MHTLPFLMEMSSLEVLLLTFGVIGVVAKISDKFGNAIELCLVLGMVWLCWPSIDGKLVPFIKRQVQDLYSMQFPAAAAERPAPSPPASSYGNGTPYGGQSYARRP